MNSMSGEGSSPTESVVSPPVEMMLRGLERRLSSVRPTLGGAITRGVLIETFLWKPSKSVYHCSKTQQHIILRRALCVPMLQYSEMKRSICNNSAVMGTQGRQTATSTLITQK